MSVYLDYNASAPIDERVLNFMIDVYKNHFGNADSRTHTFGEDTRSIVEAARKQVASLLGVKADEVFFTSGATESNNIVILGLEQYGKRNNKKHIITSAIEHKSVLEPLKHMSENGFEITYIKPDKSGRISAKKVIESVRDDTLLVSIMHANNETGIIQPVKEIGYALAKLGVFFHIDASQSFGKLVDELRDIKYDMLSASAHKMYGPQGIGILILRKKRYKLPPVSPITYGGKQEYGIRPGTVPTALIAGLGEASRIASQEYICYSDCYLNNKKKIFKLLDESHVAYQINGEQEFCMPNTVNIAFEDVNSEALMLASRQYCGISNGSACNSNSYEKSHVLVAMDIDEDIINNSVRISWGAQPIKIEEVKHMLETVKKLHG